MATSTNPVNPAPPRRAWFRRYHRWLGGVAAFFVLLLAFTGIALNHGHNWKLDRAHVEWRWVLDLYGIEAPAPSDSFAANGKRVTLLGGALFFERAAVANEVPALTGMVAIADIFLVAGETDVILLTPAGELVERLNLNGALPGGIQRLGVRDGLGVIQSGGSYFVADANLTGFAPSPDDSGAGIDWSDGTPAPGDLVRDLQAQFLDRALTVERLLLDLHSGRIMGAAGVWLMDLVAISLVVLSVTGLFQWRQRRNRTLGQSQGSE